MIIGKNINLRQVEVKDAEFILSLRLDPELGKYLSSTNNDLEKQREWIEKRKILSNEWYFIVQDKDSTPVGTIRIYDIQGDSFCWGSWIIKPEARKFATFESVVRMHEFAFYELGFNRARVDARKDNDKSVNFQQRFGYSFIYEDELNLYFELLKEDYSNNREHYLALVS